MQFLKMKKQGFIMFRGRWSTINEDGTLKEYTPNEPVYNPAIEDYTDYKYTTGQKVTAIKNEIKGDFEAVAGVAADAGAAIKNTAKVVKYLPFAAAAAAALFFYKKVLV